MIINQIQGGRWDGLIRRLFPIKDRSVAPVMASELVPQVVIQEWEPEFFKLRGNEALAMGISQVSPVVGQLSAVQLFNPLAAGMLVIVEKLILRASPDALLELAYGVTNSVIPNATQRATAYRDTRFGSVPAVGVTAAELHSAANAAAVGAANEIARISVLADDSKVLDIDIVLDPGASLIVRSFNVNILLNITYLWRERSAEPSELSA